MRDARTAPHRTAPHRKKISTPEYGNDPVRFYHRDVRYRTTPLESGRLRVAGALPLLALAEFLLVPRLGAVPPVLRLALLSAALVAAMTYVVSPVTGGSSTRG
nr:hypothetical protein GCM10020093_108280 [Planobispora longispora]